RRGFVGSAALVAGGLLAGGVLRPPSALADTGPAYYDRAGTFSAPQTIAPSTGPALTLKVPNNQTQIDLLQAVAGTTGGLLSRLTNIAPAGSRAAVMTYEGSAGSWAQGIDIAAQIPYRDYFIAKTDWPNPGQVKDVLLLNHNGSGAPTVDFFGSG